MDRKVRDRTQKGKRGPSDRPCLHNEPRRPAWSILAASPKVTVTPVDDQERWMAEK